MRSALRKNGIENASDAVLFRDVRLVRLVRDTDVLASRLGSAGALGIKGHFVQGFHKRLMATLH